jgi:DNA-binding beta-propeller fold protein YncE
VVANSNNTVTEIDAATGAAVRVVSGDGIEPNGPDAVSSDGTHVWVCNYSNNTVTGFPT